MLVELILLLPVILFFSNMALNLKGLIENQEYHKFTPHGCVINYVIKVLL